VPIRHFLLLPITAATANRWPVKQDFPLRQVVKQLSKLLQEVTVPKARASIVWVIGEYQQHVPLLAPDILRILAKSFTEEVKSPPLCSPCSLFSHYSIVLFSPPDLALTFPPTELACTINRPK